MVDFFLKPSLFRGSLDEFGNEAVVRHAPTDERPLGLPNTEFNCAVFSKVVGEQGDDPTAFDRILILWEIVVFHFVVFVALTQRVY